MTFFINLARIPTEKSERQDDSLSKLFTAFLEKMPCKLKWETGVKVADDSMLSALQITQRTVMLR